MIDYQCFMNDLVMVRSKKIHLNVELWEKVGASVYFCARKVAPCPSTYKGGCV
jgi:hypothetical protein